MANYRTVFGSLGEFEKGSVEVIEGDVKHFAFSNVFEVASRARPYEKIAVAKNLEYVIEAIRAEGSSNWMAANHDEFVIVLDGEVRVEFVKLDRPGVVAPAGQEGTVLLQGEPEGKRMGRIVLGRGHQALLPTGAAYRFRAVRPSAMIQQTLAGALTIQKWGEICAH